MAASAPNTVSHDDTVQRALTFSALGTLYADALQAADATITAAWLTQLRTDAEAAQALPTYDQRRTDSGQLVLDRNAALKAASPLLMDTFFYAKKAYPDVAHPDEYFGHSLYTRAGHSVVRQNQALQAAAAAFATRRPAMEHGGMPGAKIDQLLAYAATAQGKATDYHVATGDGTVETDENDQVFAALWAKCQLLHEAAEVAFRTDDTKRRLFLLYPGGDESRALTIEPGQTRAVRLSSQLSATRLLSCTVVAPGGPVQLTIQATDAAPPAGLGQRQASTTPNHPARFAAEALGWDSDEEHYFAAFNPGTERARVEVRVLPVGSV